MALPTIDLRVYPDECDAFGHLNQASFLALFERARWAVLAEGPGMDVFTREGAWPAVRQTTIDYRHAAYPGDVLRFDQALVHLGRTSFTLRQTARRTRDDQLVATAEFVFVCIDKAGKPIPVPREAAGALRGTDASEQRERVTVNGVRLELASEGTGPPVLFVHGFPLDHTLWAHQLDHVRGWRRLAPDLRGFGASDAPDVGYSIATYADDLAALLEAVGAEPAVVVGVSMGGYVAFELARRHRARLRGLVLMDTRAEADTPDQRRGRDAHIQVVREQGGRALALQLLPRLLRPTVTGDDPATAERVRAMMAAQPVAGVIGALVALRDRPDSTATLATLAGLPTLVLVGEHDAVTPVADAQRMAAAIPGARLEVIADAGHLPMVEQPHRTTDAIQRFLDGLPA